MTKNEMNILPDKAEEAESHLFEVSQDGTVWIWNIKEPVIIEVIKLFVRKWVDTIENFAQYVARRLQRNGVITEVNSTISPTSDGYALNITIRVRGVKYDLLKKQWRLIKRHAQDRTTVSYRYKRMLDLLERLEKAGDRLGRAIRDPLTAEYIRADKEEGGAKEDASPGPRAQSHNEGS